MMKSSSVWVKHSLNTVAASMNAAIAIKLRMCGFGQVPTETAELLQAPLVQKLTCPSSLLRVQVRVERPLNLLAIAELSHGHSQLYMRLTDAGLLLACIGCRCYLDPHMHFRSGKHWHAEIHRQQAVTVRRIACMCIFHSELHCQRDSPACTGSCQIVCSGSCGACLTVNSKFHISKP